MDHVRKWTVEIFLDEHEHSTRAEARLHTGSGPGRTGVGRARLNPHDTNIPEIGDELAAARALADLAHELLDATAADIEAVTGGPARLTE
ncbi:DUF1876 domain-containing protein [Prauserella flavalba]|uniref:DUF1876 domain-containing protein n=1 Tax=Prauserella flavalba TaxID=1477506 RepID=A0A318LQ66_9PSEU|nr:DUF1876 domain-containing protein [Prauserella flavalba]PXY36551.1 hypothetical protein BA062_14315 [Prauserella flavalba]